MKKLKRVRWSKWTLRQAIHEMRLLKEWLSADDMTRISISGFAAMRGYSRQRITDWIKYWPDNEELQELYQSSKDIIENKLLVNGLLKKYNPNLAHLMLINCCGWSSAKTVTTLQGNPEQPLAMSKIPPVVEEYIREIQDDERTGPEKV